MSIFTCVYLHTCINLHVYIHSLRDYTHGSRDLGASSDGAVCVKTYHVKKPKEAILEPGTDPPTFKTYVHMYMASG